MKPRSAPEAAAPVQGPMVQCPLCGNRFPEAEGEACKYCPKPFKSCRMVMCPNCSHEFPRLR